LPGATAVEEIVKKTTEGAKVYANNMVRVNSDVQKIDKFFPSVSKVTETDKDVDLFEEEKYLDDSIKQMDKETSKDKHMERTNDSHVEEENVQNEIPNIVIDRDDEVLENSLVNEPNEVINKLPDRWKSTTAADQANATYIDPKESFKTRTFRYERVETKLTSVKQLRLYVENKCNSNLREILANLIFIACIDCHKSLIQHSTKLYLCDTTRLT
jgi:hypothetical protein